MVKLSVCLPVSTIKNLVLLQVHLNSSLVREVINCLFELYEIRNTCKAILHFQERFIYCSINWLNVTICICCVGRVRLDVIMSVLLNAMLAQRLLVCHAERVYYRFMLITIKHGCRLLWQPLIVNWLLVVHLGVMVHRNLLLTVMKDIGLTRYYSSSVRWPCSRLAYLTTSSILVHIVTHLCLFVVQSV